MEALSAPVRSVRVAGLLPAPSRPVGPAREGISRPLGDTATWSSVSGLVPAPPDLGDADSRAVYGRMSQIARSAGDPDLTASDLADLDREYTALHQRLAGSIGVRRANEAHLWLLRLARESAATQTADGRKPAGLHEHLRPVTDQPREAVAAQTGFTAESARRLLG